MALPEPCEKCAETGGYWVGGARCLCARGLTLADLTRQASTPAVPRPPVISSEEATLLAEMLSGLYGFSLNQAVPLIASEIAGMCGSFKQANEFVTRFTRLYKKWPGGLDELRWAFCQMGFRPLDAIEPVGESQVYPEGLPEAAGGRQVAAIEAPRDPRSRELPAGEAGYLVRDLARRKAL